MRWEKRSTRRKTSRSKGENQQQTQPTYDIDDGIWTWATLVRSQFPHDCPTLAPYNELRSGNQAYWFLFLQFLNAASLQLNMILTTHVPNVESNQQPEASVLRLINCLMDTMLSVFSSAPLARSVSRSSLKQLMQVLITVLSDDRLAELQDGPQIIRAINILMVKVIEMSDQTYVLG